MLWILGVLEEVSFALTLNVLSEFQTSYKAHPFLCAILELALEGAANSVTFLYLDMEEGVVDALYLLRLYSLLLARVLVKGGEWALTYMILVVMVVREAAREEDLKAALVHLE